MTLTVRLRLWSHMFSFCLADVPFAHGPLLLSYNLWIMCSFIAVDATRLFFARDLVLPWMR